MVNVVDVAIERGYLFVPEDLLIDAREVKYLPQKK